MEKFSERDFAERSKKYIKSYGLNYYKNTLQELQIQRYTSRIMPIIEVKDVSKLYGFGDATTLALDEVSLTLKKASSWRSWVRAVAARHTDEYDRSAGPANAWSPVAGWSQSIASDAEPSCQNPPRHHRIYLPIFQSITPSNGA